MGGGGMTDKMNIKESLHNQINGKLSFPVVQTKHSQIGRNKERV